MKDRDGTASTMAGASEEKGLDSERLNYKFMKVTIKFMV